MASTTATSIMSYTAAIQPSPASTALALSLLSSSSPADSTSIAHLTAHIRAALRAEQSALNDAKGKAKRARTRMEEISAEKQRLKAEREAVGLQSESEHHDPIHEQANLLPVETFQELASEELTSQLPPPSDPSYTQQLTLLRLQFELAQIQDRERHLEELQRELVQVKGRVALVKKGNLDVDAGLEEMVKAAALLETQMRSLLPALEKVDAEMDETS